MMPRSPQKRHATSLRFAGGTIVVFAIISMALHLHNYDGITTFGAPPALSSSSIQQAGDRGSATRQEQQTRRPFHVHLAPAHSIGTASGQHHARVRSHSASPRSRIAAFAVVRTPATTAGQRPHSASATSPGRTLRPPAALQQRAYGSPGRPPPAGHRRPSRTRTSSPDHNLAVTVTSRPPRPLQLPYALWWFAPFFTGSGYGLEGQHYMLALAQGGLVRPADLWLSQHGDYPSQSYVDSIPDAERKQLHSMALNPTSSPRRTAIMVCHSLPGFWTSAILKKPWIPAGSDHCPGPPGRSAYKVGRTMCEVDGIPALMAASCNQMDEVWVPSPWARDVFIASGVVPQKLVVVPEGVDTVKFDPARYDPVQLPVGRLVLGQQQDRANGRRPFVFLSTFKWESRKGYDVLLKAYLQEFQPHEPVELYIMTKPFGTSGTDIATTVQDWVRENLMPPPPPIICTSTTTNTTVACPEPPLPHLPTVYIITNHIPDSELPRHYRAADAFVLPSRGEGWGRPHVEAMSMGLPLISTNWSGMTAYLDASVGYPIALESLVPADGNNAPYFKGFKWAQPSVHHLRQLMRHVVNHPEEARALGQAARERMVAEYSSEVVGLKVLREVLRITRKLQAYGASLVAPPPRPPSPPTPGAVIRGIPMVLHTNHDAAPHKVSHSSAGGFHTPERAPKSPAMHPDARDGGSESPPWITDALEVPSPSPPAPLEAGDVEWVSE